MKSFKLDHNGDVVVSARNLVMVDGNDLLRQTVETVLRTNQGEWFLDEEEGIDFNSILKKMPDYDEIRGEILGGLRQVDQTFVLETYEYSLDGRKLQISFKARNGDGELVDGAVSYN